MLAFSLQFYSYPYRFFHFTPGLYVEFPGAGGGTRRGLIVQASGRMAQVMDETSGQRVRPSRSMLLAGNL